jgi:hypothetical protein
MTGRGLRKLRGAAGPAFVSAKAKALVRSTIVTIEIAIDAEADANEFSPRSDMKAFTTIS